MSSLIVPPVPVHARYLPDEGVSWKKNPIGGRALIDPLVLTMEIIAREGWNADPPKHRHTIPLPTPELWLHHSAGSGANETTVKAIQRFHMGPLRGWSDIAYSFLIDNDAPDVDIFEGRGAGVAGGHTKGHNTRSHAICVIGNFTNTPPHPATVDAIVELAAYGYLMGWWRLGFSGGHRDASGASTSCPGDALHRMIPEINRRITELVTMAQTRFADVPEDHVFYDHIEKMAEKGVTRGAGVDKKGRPLYRPDDPVTRGQLAAFFDRLGLLDR